MTGSVSGSVAVITGASSGIGRATALELAKRGAAVVLAARREGPLVALANECEREGGNPLVVVTDVTDPGAVDELASRAVERFGHIDVWVNNAAVMGFGTIDAMPLDVFRKIIDVNVMGYVHGARAALREFRRHGRGVLVNVGSIASKISEPMVSAYVASKHAVRGLTESLRQETALAGETDIHVCLVMPATIDTPLFQHAANYAGRAARAMPPVYPAERVAKAIVSLIDRPKREVIVGTSGRVFDVAFALAPAKAERKLAKSFPDKHLQDLSVPNTRGNLFEPSPNGDGVSGGWLPPPRKGRAKAVGLGLAAAAALGFVGWQLAPQLRRALGA